MYFLVAVSTLQMPADHLNFQNTPVSSVVDNVRGFLSRNQESPILGFPLLNLLGHFLIFHTLPPVFPSILDFSPFSAVASADAILLGPLSYCLHFFCCLFCLLAAVFSTALLLLDDFCLFSTPAYFNVLPGCICYAYSVWSQ